MLRKHTIVITTVAATVLCGCKTANSIPIDDAYHIETLSQSVEPAPSSEAVQEPSVQREPGSKQPTITFTNVKDTTITAIIKR